MDQLYNAYMLSLAAMTPLTGALEALAIIVHQQPVTSLSKPVEEADTQDEMLKG